MGLGNLILEGWISVARALGEAHRCRVPKWLDAFFADSPAFACETDSVRGLGFRGLGMLFAIVFVGFTLVHTIADEHSTQGSPVLWSKVAAQLAYSPEISQRIHVATW